MKVTANDVLRFLLELFALFSIGFWGFVAFDFPWPALLTGIGAPVVAAVLWGLFRSPKSVVPLPPFGRVVVEVIVMGAAVVAWLLIAQPWIALVFGVIALASGIVNLRREIARSSLIPASDPEAAS